MKNMMKYLQFTFIFLAVLVVLPLRANAAMTSFEVQEQLRVISFVLSNLASELQKDKADLFLIRSEIQRISNTIPPLVLEASLALSSTQNQQGQVLGATFPTTSSRPLAEVDITPGSTSNNVTVNNRRLREVLSFKIEPFFSDIWVQQVEVVFDREISNYIDEIVLTAGGKTLFELTDLDDDDFSEIEKDKAFAFRFSGFLEEIREDRTKTFEVELRARESRSFSGLDTRVYLRNGAIRFIDEANFNQQIPYYSAGERGRFSNEFEIDGTD